MKHLEKINREEFSMALPADLHAHLLEHLLRDDGQEDVAFALYKPSLGINRFTGLIHRIIMPNEDERSVHGNVEIKPKYFRRVCSIAAAEKSGVALLHSHLGPGWQGMSIDDIKTERGYGSSSVTLTELPFIGLTLGTDASWSARIWEYNNGWLERKMASTVRVVGKRLHVSYNDLLRPKPAFKETFKRTVTVWGKENHEHLARLRIGIIGLGSVGSIVAESLARIGIERLVLIDFDEVQEHNLDRLLGATKGDIGHAKVYVAHRQVSKASTAAHFDARIVQQGVTEEQGYLHALDCDVLFSCVDRPWPRHVLNHIAYNHLIPIIDGGIKVRLDPNTGKFEGADWQLQSVSPGRICLSCLGAYHTADVATEKAGLLEDPSYIAGLPFDSHFKRNENIFPFSMNLASLEVLQLVEMATGIGCEGEIVPQRYVYNQGYIRLLDNRQCDVGCLFQEGMALGDTLFDPPWGIDHSANQARARQTGGA